MGETDERQLKNRFSELAARADRQCCWTNTDFLSLAEQDTLLRMREGAKFVLDGGYENAERRIAFFGSEEDFGYAYDTPICCVKIESASKKFAEKLTHRDYLGALMSKGVERKAMGDILIAGDTAYLFCLEGIADYMISMLDSVRHTSVRCSYSEAPKELCEPPETVSITVASERLDALVAAVYKVSRSAAKELILQSKVYIDSKLTENAGAEIKEGAKVSVRGKGRFIYEGISRETKKGRLCVNVKIYK